MSGTNVKPRKRPRSRSGAQITEAILQAASELIEQGGMKACTTNRMASRAGVSIGSLYQYFPNKQAIMAELARRMEERTLALIAEALRDYRDQPLTAVVRAVAHVLVGGHLGGHGLRQVLRDEIPQSWTREASRQVDEKVRAMLADEFARRTEVRDGPYELMALVVGHSVEHVVEVAVAQDSSLLDDPRLVDELVMMVTRYLAPA